MVDQGSTSFLRKYDFTFLSLNLAIFVIGIINLYSATQASGTTASSGIVKYQIVYFVLSLFVAIGTSLISPKSLFRMAYPIYAINVLLLILVLILGHTGMGAQRWLVFGPIRFQPSEFMKISIALALARWMCKHGAEKDLDFKSLIIPFLITLFPAVLIIVEPDLGTGLLIMLIFSVIAFYRKLKWKTILIIGILGIVAGSLMYIYGLKEYQRKRIKTFIDPTADARGSGYNAIQSKIAIGSGQFFGKGYKKSSQASFNYLPENHTDFVFSVYNEEHGFFGSLVLIVLYLSLIFRYIWLSSNVSRMFESILSIGIMSIFFWHTVINMMMVTGLMPIVGLPLPLMSYGGSSLLTFGVAAGIATSISNSRNLF